MLSNMATLDQRLEDRLVGVHAGADVDNGNADTGRLIGPAGDTGEAGLRLDQQVVGLAGGVGAAFAVAGYRALDQPGEALGQHILAIAQTAGGARFEVLDEHVGAGEHRIQQRLVGGCGEIDANRLLAAIKPDKI
jgi:hypothetical protein